MCRSHPVRGMSISTVATTTTTIRAVAIMFGVFATVSNFEFGTDTLVSANNLKSEAKASLPIAIGGTKVRLPRFWKWDFSPA